MQNLMTLVCLTVCLHNFHAAQNANQYCLIELNHVESSLSQIVVWDWNHQYGRYDCHGWIMADRVEQLTFSSPYRFRVKEGDYAGAILQSRVYRETRTHHDPEIENRRLFPIENRRRIQK